MKLVYGRASVVAETMLVAPPEAAELVAAALEDAPMCTSSCEVSSRFSESPTKSLTFSAVG